MFDTDSKMICSSRSRVVARFFCKGKRGGGGGIIASAEGTRLVGGSGGSEILFSALVMRYVSETSISNMKMASNCKVTESRENKSIRRLDVSDSTGPGGGGGQLPSLLPC